MFQFVKDGMKKDFILLMVGTGREWMKSSIGLQIAEQVRTFIMIKAFRIHRHHYC